MLLDNLLLHLLRFLLEEVVRMVVGGQLPTHQLDSLLGRENFSGAGSHGAAPIIHILQL